MEHLKQARKQREVWVRTDENYITTDTIKSDNIQTDNFGISLFEDTYGEDWALTRNELTR